MTQDTNQPKPFVFVLMPFAEEFADIYHLGIKAACDEAGAYSERVDEQHFDGSIVERIYNQISKADVIVSDMTGRNANVFYETGYAHALGKRTILLTQQANDIPFDLKHLTHIVYGHRIITLKEQLVPKLEWAINNPEKEVVDPLSTLSFHLSGAEILGGQKFTVPVEFLASAGTLVNSNNVPLTTKLKIDVQNKSPRTFDASGVQIGLEMPSELAASVGKLNVIRLADSRSLVMFDNLTTFLPHSWQSLAISLPNKTLKNLANEHRAFRLEIFTELGTKYLDFELAFSDSKSRVVT